MFVDTHTHLYHKRFDEDREAMVQRALDAGVKKLFLPNIDGDSVDAMHEMVEQWPEVCYPMMGLHPCSVNEDPEKALNDVEKRLRTGNYCAVGEIGIDLYWDKTYLTQQQQAFRQQVQWAKELALPIVIHCRDSFNEVIEIVEEEHKGQLRGVFHCFTGTVEEAERVLALDHFYLGIGGVITFPNGGLDVTMARVGASRCLLETDAPYLAPVPHRGKRNESAYIPMIAARLAGATGRTVDEIAAITTRNAEELFDR